MNAALASELITVPPGDGGRSIDDLLRDVSASRLTTFHQCRLRFWFRYLSGIVKPKPAALHLGSSVHETLKFWNRARWHRRAPSLRDLHDAFSGAWAELREADSPEFEDEDGEKQTGWKLLETYFRESPIPGDERPEAVEVSVEADLSTHGLPKLVGVLDLVRPGGRIVDFKTSGKTPDPEQVAHTTEGQTTAYSLLYREATGGVESGIEIHTLVKTKAPKLIVTALPPATDAQVTRLFRGIESYVAGLEREDFVPSPGLQCASCEFFNECRRHWCH
jgi:putative RecB family exonuclease